MSITLSDTTTTVELDPDLFWPDEHSWSPVVQTVRYKLDGALSVQVSTRQAGRPITLQGDDEHGWARMTGLVVAQLREWASAPAKQLTLALHGSTYTVVFRHNEPPAFDARNRYDYAVGAADDCYVVTLKLMVI